MGDIVNNKNISVIMSVYNGEKVVKRAIDSVINQTYKDIELIVVNDGSNDGTKNIIEVGEHPEIEKC